MILKEEITSLLILLREVVIIIIEAVVKEAGVL